jgi:hypothetical protein
MKYVSIRIPEPGPFGETLFEARDRAIVAASFVNRPSGGCVESVVTRATHFLADFLVPADIVQTEKELKRRGDFSSRPAVTEPQ